MDDVDALYSLPLTEFTAARDALAKALKKSGQADEAQRVKALAKPSISAWAVNQLYWKHREAFDRLMATGQQFRERQASQFAGKVVEKTFGDERRRALSDLSRLAANLMQEAGHNATPDIIRRITSTLEAMSAHASLPEAPHYGRLAGDLDPPGFEALAALIPDAGVRQPPRKEVAAGRDKTQQSRIAEAKAALCDAERALKEARAEAGAMDSSLKKANQKVKEAEKQKRHLEAQLRTASETVDEAERRARAASERAEEAARAVEDATRGVEKASESLQSLLR